MLNRILSDIQFVLASKSYKMKDIPVARYHMDKCLQYMKNPDAVALAFDATLMIFERRFEDARKRFEEVRTKENTLLPGDRRYLTHYCKYYECLYEQAGDCDEYRMIAMECKTSRGIRKWLLLSNTPTVE